MTGRFFSAPLFVCAILIARASFPSHAFPVLAFAILSVGALGINNTLFSGLDYQQTKVSNSGIADERGFYFQRLGLITSGRDTFRTPKWKDVEPGARRNVSTICGLLGLTGVKEGPSLHLLDVCGLADPLIARLPAQKDRNWRIGHFLRQIPENYEESLAQRKNLLVDEDTRDLYENIFEATRLPLFSLPRLRAILALNLGSRHYDLSKYRFEPVKQESDIPAYSAERLSTPVENGAAWDDRGNVLIGKAVDIVLPDREKIKGITLVLSAGGRYRVDRLIFGANYSTLTVCGPTGGVGDVMQNYEFRWQPDGALTSRIRVTPVSGDGRYSLGSFKVAPETYPN